MPGPAHLFLASSTSGRPAAAFFQREKFPVMFNELFFMLF
jgi:hypothetical protein